MNIFSCVLHISNYKKQFSTCCPYLTKTIISQCRTYNVPNLCIYLPIFSVFNTICYSFMVHSFHRAALILLPVSQNCYRYLKNAVQYFLYNLISFIYSIFFFITTRTFVRFIFHSKFIEPTINTHAISSCSINCNCDGINMFSSSEFSHIRDFSNF